MSSSSEERGLLKKLMKKQEKKNKNRKRAAQVEEEPSSSESEVEVKPKKKSSHRKPMNGGDGNAGDYGLNNEDRRKMPTLYSESNQNEKKITPRHFGEQDATLSVKEAYSALQEKYDQISEDWKTCSSMNLDSDSSFETRLHDQMLKILNSNISAEKPMWINFFGAAYLNKYSTLFNNNPSLYNSILVVLTLIICRGSESVSQLSATKLKVAKSLSFNFNPNSDDDDSDSEEKYEKPKKSAKHAIFETKFFKQNKVPFRLGEFLAKYTIPSEFCMLPSHCSISFGTITHYCDAGSKVSVNGVLGFPTFHGINIQFNKPILCSISTKATSAAANASYFLILNDFSFAKELLEKITGKRGFEPNLGQNMNAVWSDAETSKTSVLSSTALHKQYTDGDLLSTFISSMGMLVFTNEGFKLKAFASGTNSTYVPATMMDLSKIQPKLTAILNGKSAKTGESPSKKKKIEKARFESEDETQSEDEVVKHKKKKSNKTKVEIDDATDSRSESEDDYEVLKKKNKKQSKLEKPRKGEKPKKVEREEEKDKKVESDTEEMSEILDVLKDEEKNDEEEPKE